jgi:hypothetical protein
MVTLTRRWPDRYFSGLSRRLQFVRERELLRRRSKLHPKLGRSNLGVKKRKSKWTGLFHKTYPGLKFNKVAISRRTRIPVSVLNTVYDRGIKAWKTGGSRPGTTAPQWGIARLYKFVLVTKKKAPKAWYAKRADPDQDLRRLP